MYLLYRCNVAKYCLTLNCLALDYSTDVGNGAEGETSEVKIISEETRYITVIKALKEKGQIYGFVSY